MAPVQTSTGIRPRPQYTRGAFPSTLICHENVAFRKRSSNWRNSCHWSWACCQIFLCLEGHKNKAKGPMQCRIDPFASFACQTADKFEQGGFAFSCEQKTFSKRSFSITMRLRYSCDSVISRPIFPKTQIQNGRWLLRFQISPAGRGLGSISAAFSCLVYIPPEKSGGARAPFGW